MKVPGFLMAIGVDSPTELFEFISLSVSLVISIFATIWWRKRARQIRCASETVDSADCDELHRREAWRNRWAWATVLCLGGILWIIHPMAVIAGLIFIGSFMIDAGSVPRAYLWPAKDR